jgi:purine nucleosidase
MAAALPIIIDCDPGIDDAVALLIAWASPELDIRGVCAVSGNAPIEATLNNVLQVRDLAGAPATPVFRGCHRPLLREPVRGRFSGVKGLGGLVLPPPSRPAENRHAVTFLVEKLIAAAKSGTPITLCVLGPLTNIAVALLHAPEVAAGIARIVLMGGAFREAGNRTMAAEFNILADPQAAHVVFSSGIPLVIAPLDASHQAIATPARVARIAALGGRAAAVIAELLTVWDRKDPARYGSLGGPLHDPLVIAYLIRPELFRTERAAVFVQHESAVTLGQTIADWWNASGATPNADIITGVDADGFFDLVCERLGRLAGAASPAA